MGMGIYIGILDASRVSPFAVVGVRGKELQAPPEEKDRHLLEESIDEHGASQHLRLESIKGSKVVLQTFSRPPGSRRVRKLSS